MPPSCFSSLEPLNCFVASILAYLLVHIPIGTTKKKGTQKETKTKEFTHSFLATKSNYIHLLNIILKKHHIGNKFHATVCRYYSCKIQVPSANKADACDVINYGEYEDIANKVLKKKLTRIITIFVNMKDIEKIRSADTEDVSDNDDKADDEYSKLELKLARLRELLKKKYRNNYDAENTYIDSVTGDSVPLTLFIMKEWARAMISI